MDEMRTEHLNILLSSVSISVLLRKGRDCMHGTAHGSSRKGGIMGCANHGLVPVLLPSAQRDNDNNNIG